MQELSLLLLLLLLRLLFFHLTKPRPRLISKLIRTRTNTNITAGFETILIIIITHRYLTSTMARYHYYVVYRGHQPGIYHCWIECKANVHVYPNAQYKGFTTLEDATDSFYRFIYTERNVVGNVPRRSPNVQEALVLNRFECLLWAVIFILCVIFLMWDLVIYIAFSMSY